jgi:hypothetical protein
MDVEARDALQNGLRRKVNRHISTEIGKTAAHLLNAFEPLVTGENGEGKVASQKGSLQNFLRLSDIDAFLGFAPRSESNIGEVSVICQPLVCGVTQGMDSQHVGFLSEGGNITVKKTG